MNSKPFIIAELSGNHNGDINRALRLIELAKANGADAVKLQTYTPDTMTIDCDAKDFILDAGPWKGYKLYDLYHDAQTPWEWHAALFQKGKEIGIPIFSTPFDETAVDYLETLNAPFYKVASFELIHLPLIKYIAKLKKPMIMSTGLSNLEDITDAVEAALNNGCEDLSLLHCVSAYPSRIEDSNLAMIPELKKLFPNLKIGLSDHTLGTSVAIAAVALGAEIIEKHITLRRSDGGVDAAFSLEPEELAKLCSETKSIYNALHQTCFERKSEELQNIVFRRSIYAIREIPEGATFSVENIKIIRPGFGLKPKHYEAILGKPSPRAFKRGDPIELLMVD